MLRPTCSTEPRLRILDFGAPILPCSASMRQGAGPVKTMAAGSAAHHAGPQTSPRTVAEAWPIFIRHASPRLLLATAPVAIAARIVLGRWSLWDLGILAALVAIWPVQEWLIHVHLLHFRPFTLWGRSVDSIVARKHREHHRDPWNYRILFIPFHACAAIIPFELVLWFSITPTAALAMTGIAVSLALTLHYEWIHFLIHTRVTAPTRFYHSVWRNHRLHHFKNERYWFGVTRLEGDWILGTAPPPDDVPISPTARTLGIASS